MIEKDWSKKIGQTTTCDYFTNDYFSNGYFTNDYFKLKKDLPVFLPSLETGRSFAIYTIYIIYNCFTAIMTTFFDRKPSLCTIFIILILRPMNCRRGCRPEFRPAALPAVPGFYGK